MKKKMKEEEVFVLFMEDDRFGLRILMKMIMNIMELLHRLKQSIV